MARSVDNIFTSGIKGMVAGQMVFRSWNNKTYVSKSPRKPTKQSSLQKDNRTKFRRATAFAKKMMADPVKKVEYKVIAKDLQLPNAYTAAVTEYMRKPEILDIEVQQQGEETQEIKIVTSKKGFDLQEVEVEILDGSNRMIEKGKAAKLSGNNWFYLPVLQLNSTFHVLVRIRDKADNIVEQSLKQLSANILNKPIKH